MWKRPSSKLSLTTCCSPTRPHSPPHGGVHRSEVRRRVHRFPLLDRVGGHHFICRGRRRPLPETRRGGGGAVCCVCRLLQGAGGGAAGALGGRAGGAKGRAVVRPAQYKSEQGSLFLSGCFPDPSSHWRVPGPPPLPPGIWKLSCSQLRAIMTMVLCVHLANI